MPFGYRKAENLATNLALPEIFGIRSLKQLLEDYSFVLSRFGQGGFQFVDVSSLKHFRPDLAWPAYLGYVPESGLSPICNLFDRVGGGKSYNQRVTRANCGDYRGQELTYDEHDGTDFVCPVGTPLVAAAPGLVTLIRDRWLRGGLTVTIDHGAGITTQYTHLSQVRCKIGDTVSRGQTIALSGSAGIDMTTFFPMVPPHIHFMVWRYGQPVDPFLADGEAEMNGNWQQSNNPRPGQSDTSFKRSEIDSSELNRFLPLCSDAKIKKEIQDLKHNSLALAALLEDSFHHDAFAWPDFVTSKNLRIVDEGEVRLSLPLDWSAYSGAYCADG